MRVLIRTILISLILSFICCVSHFNFELQRNEDLCFSEYFSDKTLVIYTVEANSPIELKISDPDDKIKFQKVKQHIFQIYFHSYHE